VLLLVLLGASTGRATDIVHTIATVKSSVVAVGSYLPTRSPAVAFSGTGFVVGDGLSVVTNAHVVPAYVDTENKEQVGVIVGYGERFEFRPAVSIRYDKEHDLAHIRLAGAPLPALAVGDSNALAEGQVVAFTGFPLGMVLGLHPVTHRAMISAITPIVIPSLSAKQLDAKMIARLHQPPLNILQLDGTAYPGNSGSPVYDPDTGAVVGVINMVFVKGLKENAISNPSGITYAIPSQFVRGLLQEN
jgi:S1-C subfamily serine protease